MADNFWFKSLIWNASDWFKSDFITKIDEALKKLDGVWYSSPASATWEPVGMSVASPKKAWTTAATTPDISEVAYAMEAPKAKKKKEEKIEKILGDDSIYSNITDKYHNKQDFMKTEKEEQKDIRNWNAPFLWNSNYTEEEQAAKDKLRAENTAKYRDEMMGKQYDKDMEKWSKFVQSSEDADQDLIDYINWIQWALEWTWFNKIKRERLRDWLQWLINTLIYEDDDKYTTDFLKNTSDYVAGWTHASASDNKINEALQAIQTLKEMRDIILKEKLGWKKDNDLYL